jgi:hypothetical protein
VFEAKSRAVPGPRPSTAGKGRISAGQRRRAGGLLATVGNRLAGGDFGAGLLPPAKIVPVARQEPANYDDPPGIGITDDLMGRV